MHLKPTVQNFQQSALSSLAGQSQAPAAVRGQRGGTPPGRPVGPAPHSPRQASSHSLSMSDMALLGATLTTGSALSGLAGSQFLPPTASQFSLGKSWSRMSVENGVYGTTIGASSTLAGGFVAVALADNPKEGALYGAAAGAATGAMLAAEYSGLGVGSLAYGLVVGAVSGGLGGAAASYVKDQISP